MMKKKYFNSEFVNFFSELAQNNHKPWFDENRHRYQQFVKEPFDNLVKDLIVEINKLDERIAIPYSKAIFRINKDIRFSKDKEPYKINRSAIISPFGTKDKSFPGMYFEINANELRIYGGVYMLDSKQIQRVREEIADHLADFQKIYKSAVFKKAFGTVQGEKSKRIPKEFEAVGTQEPLIYNKNWYVFTKLPIDTIYKEDLLKVLVDHYKILQPYDKFFERAVVG